MPFLQQEDVETFGSSIKKIYSLCESAKVDVDYVNSETSFSLEFSRIDRNIMPEGGVINGRINGTISDFENKILDLLRKDNHITTKIIVEMSGKSIRTVNRAISSLKDKGLIERIGSNKTGYWKVI